MIYLIILLFIISIIFNVLLLIAVNKLFKYITESDETIEECVEILNSSYEQIYKYSKIPVFYNEPVIKGLLQSIKKSQESVLMVSEKIQNVKYYGKTSNEKEESQKAKE
jgi:ABC-type cobalt transport system substrate-binding protein